MKEPKAIAKVILMLQKHQESMKSGPQRIQNCALDAVDPVSKTDVQNTDINLTTSLRAYHLCDKTTKEWIICKNSVMIEIAIVHTLQEPYHSKLHNKLSLVMTYHLVSMPFNAFLENRQKYSLKKKPDIHPKI